ncbi:MAG: NADPH:quinone reductase-like Zn-dependent oxidoreductase [Yoonia sp.]
MLKAHIFGKRLVGGVAKESRDIIEAVVKLAVDGVLQPVIDKCYPFGQMIAAHRHVDTGHKKGNIVVLIYQEPAADVRSDF